MALYYNIGDLKFRLSGAEEERLMRRYKGFGVFECEACSMDFEILVNATLQADTSVAGEVLSDFVFKESNCNCRLGKTAGSWWFEMRDANTLEQQAMLSYKGGNVVEISPCKEFSHLRFLIWMAYGLWGMKQERMLIHSSCVVNNGWAVMFLGESGTGKSTHSRLWLEHIPNTSLLNDDSPLLCVEGDEVKVYGSPWSGKTPCYKTECYPLKGIVRLEQAPTNEIKQTSILEGLSCLHPSCPPALARDEFYLDLMMQQIGKVLTRMPLYKLKCLPNAEAAKLSYSTLFKQE